MNQAQMGLYHREWAKVRRALRGLGRSPQEADAERHALHVRALGEDKSSRLLTNGEFDAVLSAFRAISQPGNLQTQLDLQRMAATRELVTLRHYLGALAQTDAHAERIAAQMNLHGRIGQPAEEDRAYVRDAAGEKVMFDYADTRNGEPRRRGLTLDDLAAPELRKLVIAVKKECRREWRTKVDLLNAIGAVCRSAGFDGRAAGPAICAALNVPPGTPLDLEDWNYETLLVALAALRTCAAPAAAAVEEEEEPAELENCPY